MILPKKVIIQARPGVTKEEIENKHLKYPDAKPAAKPSLPSSKPKKPEHDEVQHANPEIEEDAYLLLPYRFLRDFDDSLRSHGGRPDSNAGGPMLPQRARPLQPLPGSGNRYDSNGVSPEQAYQQRPTEWRIQGRGAISPFPEDSYPDTETQRRAKAREARSPYDAHRETGFPPSRVEERVSHRPRSFGSVISHAAKIPSI